jgi:putative MATE family efflux protein
MTSEIQTTAGNPLGYEKTGKLLRKFAIPSVVSMLVNSLYNIVDQIFIGRGVGYIGNAATNVSFPLVTLTLAITLMIGNGCAANMSLLLGQSKRQEASEGVGTALVMTIIAAVVIFVCGKLLIQPMLLLFGATETVLPYALDYTSIILYGLPFVMMSMTLNAIIRADGSPKYSMFSMLSGAILNIILDPIFIFVFDMGVKGAAYATIIGQVLGFAVSVVYLGKFKHVDFKLSYLKLKFRLVKMITMLGTSSFIVQFSGLFVQIVMNNSLKHYGALSVYGSDIPLSALGIVMKINMILLSVVLGISIGSQPIIGFNYGAKNYSRVKETYRTVLIISCAITFGGFLVFMFAPQAIISIFGQENDLYNEFAVKCFRIFLMGIFMAGFHVPTSGYFQAVGKPLRSAILSLARQVGFLIPLMIIFPLFFGLDGILYSGPFADLATTILTFFFIRKEWKLLKVQEQGIPLVQ